MELLSKNIRKIKDEKKKLESTLKIKINIKGNKLELEGEQLDLFVANNVFLAINAGFTIRTALLVSNEEYLLERIPIKNLTQRQIYP